MKLLSGIRDVYRTILQIFTAPPPRGHPHTRRKFRR